MKRFLLDTNVVIWMMAGDRNSVSSKAIDLVDDPSNSLVISAVTIWEIAIKRSIGKLKAPDSWFDTIVRMDAENLPVTPRHAQGVEKLPGHHRDPFDRLLISQAAAEEIPIVSADSRFSSYDVDVVW